MYWLTKDKLGVRSNAAAAPVANEEGLETEITHGENNSADALKGSYYVYLGRLNADVKIDGFKI